MDLDAVETFLLSEIRYQPRSPKFTSLPKRFGTPTKEEIDALKGRFAKNGIRMWTFDKRDGLFYYFKEMK